MDAIYSSIVTSFASCPQLSSIHLQQQEFDARDTEKTYIKYGIAMPPGGDNIGNDLVSFITQSGPHPQLENAPIAYFYVETLTSEQVESIVGPSTGVWYHIVFYIELPNAAE